MAFVGESFSKEITLTEAQIKHFATLCDDQNPMHHDEAYAAQTRFGKIIASGPHYSALFVAMTATHFSKTTPGVGLEFTLKFWRPVYANIRLTMTWTATKIEHKESLAGDIVSLAGTITDENGLSLMIGEGKLLLTEKL